MEQSKLKRPLTPAERNNIEPSYKMSKSGKVVYDSETQKEINKYNQKIAMAISDLVDLARNGTFDNMSGEYDDVIYELSKGNLNSSTNSFIASLVDHQNEQVQISAKSYLKGISQKKKKQIYQTKVGRQL